MHIARKMFLIKTFFLFFGFFVMNEGKNYGKNCYPKKYSHSIHKRVNPNYWEDLTLENNFLPIQSLPKTKSIDTNEESEPFQDRSWLRRKKQFAFLDVNSSSPSPVILKRFKKNNNSDAKKTDKKQKKYKTLQKSEMPKNNFSKYGKNKKPLLKKKESFPVLKI